MRSLLTTLFIVVTVSQNLFADDDFSNINFNSTLVGSSIYMLEGAGGNITASIGSDGVLLVDDDFAQMGPKLLLKLKELNGDRPRFIINTHFHYDHTGGNEFFGSTATIIAATAVRERLQAEQMLWGSKHAAVPSLGLPNLTFNQSLTIHINNDDIQVMHLPHGHTDGDSVVFFKKENVASLGDLYFSGMFPIFHIEHAGSLNGFVKDIEFAIEKISNDARIIPGHGPLSTKSELISYHQMILKSIKTVKSGIKQKLTLEQIQNLGLPKRCEPFSHGYLATNQWIALLYKGLNQQKK
jgi:cyclase